MQTQEIFSKILIIVVYFQFVLIVLQELRFTDKIIGCAGGNKTIGYAVLNINCDCVSRLFRVFQRKKFSIKDYSTFKNINCKLHGNYVE